MYIPSRSTLLNYCSMNHSKIWQNPTLTKEYCINIHTMSSQISHLMQLNYSTAFHHKFYIFDSNFTVAQWWRSDSQLASNDDNNRTSSTSTENKLKCNKLKYSAILKLILIINNALTTKWNTWDDSNNEILRVYNINTESRIQEQWQTAVNSRTHLQTSLDNLVSLAHQTWSMHTRQF